MYFLNFKKKSICSKPDNTKPSQPGLVIYYPISTNYYLINELQIENSDKICSILHVIYVMHHDALNELKLSNLAILKNPKSINQTP